MQALLLKSMRSTPKPKLAPRVSRGIGLCSVRNSQCTPGGSGLGVLETILDKEQPFLPVFPVNTLKQAWWSLQQMLQQPASLERQTKWLLQPEWHVVCTDSLRTKGQMIAHAQEILAKVVPFSLATWATRSRQTCEAAKSNDLPQGSAYPSLTPPLSTACACAL